MKTSFALCRPWFMAKNRLFPQTPPPVMVLIYHNIPPEEREAFRRQVGWIAGRYPVVTPEEFHQYLEGESTIEKRSVLITFDDGFKSNLWAAEEVLGPLNIKALFFIASGFTDLAETENWPQMVSEKMIPGFPLDRANGPEWAPMSWSEVNRLKDQGHSLGCHTVNHFRMSRGCDPETLEGEMELSRTRLAEMTGVWADSLAYPFGDLDSICQEAFRTATGKFRFGYTGLAGENRPDTPRLALRRYPVDPSFPLGYLRLLIENGLDFYYRGRRKNLDAMCVLEQN